MAQIFSRDFLDGQQQKLTKEKENIQRQIDLLIKDDPFSDPDHVIDNAAVDTEVREQEHHQRIEMHMKDLKRRLVDIENALRKLEKGTYGYDEKTNEPIPIARLKLIPEARHNVEVKK